MSISSIKKLRSGVFGGISAITIAAVLASVSPAAANTAAPDARQAATAAALVESVTGTAELATTSGTSSTSAKTTVRGQFGDVVISAPADSSGKIEATAADGSTLRLGLPEAGKVTGAKAGAGTIVYPNAAHATDFAVQPISDGRVRTLVTLKNASAPSEYRFDLDLPEGTRLAADGNGGFNITTGNASGATVLGAIEAPWAQDANGAEVPTGYHLEGNALIQTVTPGKDAAFPIVADPSVSFGTGVYIKFNKSEVWELRNKVSYLPSAAAACGLLVVPAAAVACAGISGAALVNIQNVWKYAAANDRCVEIKMTYVGMYSGVKHYGC